MSSTPTCPRCGAPLARPEDPCPRCLLRVGIEASSLSAGAERVPAPSIAELQPHFAELELLELIGEGGMGAVYKARDRKLDRVVALKILTVKSDEASAQFDERFAREARAMASLSHPNIAAVYGFGKAGPWSYLVLEFVEGDNLRRVMRTRVVTPKDALAWVGEICDALQFAHEHGVVHRDIKPENILIDREGRAKVVDFGLAKLIHKKPGEATLTQPQQSLGTWHYMAPEQYERPREVDHRADIYSLGVVFYELLTGQVPVGRFDLPSQRIQVDVRVDDVVLKALAREPEKRYQAASEVKSDVAGLDTPAAPRSTANGHGGRGVGVAVALIVGAVLTLAFVLWLGLLFFGVRATGGPASVIAIDGPGSSTSGTALRTGPGSWLPWLLIFFGFPLLLGLPALVWWRFRRARPTAPQDRATSQSGSVPHERAGAAAWIASAVAALVTFFLASGCLSVFALLFMGDRMPGPGTDLAEFQGTMQGLAFGSAILRVLSLLAALGVGFAVWRHFARRGESASSSAPQPAVVNAPAATPRKSHTLAWVLGALVVVGLGVGCVGALALWFIPARMAASERVEPQPELRYAPMQVTPPDPSEPEPPRDR